MFKSIYLMFIFNLIEKTGWMGRVKKQINLWWFSFKDVLFFDVEEVK